MKKETLIIKDQTINCIELEDKIKSILGQYDIRSAYINFFSYGNELHARIGYFHPKKGYMQEAKLSSSNVTDLILDLEDILRVL